MSANRCTLKHPEHFDPKPEDVTSKSIMRKRLRYSGLFPHIYGSIRSFCLFDENNIYKDMEYKEPFTCSFEMDLPARDVTCPNCKELSDHVRTFYCLYNDTNGKLIVKCIKHPFIDSYTIEASPLPRILENHKKPQPFNDDKTPQNINEMPYVPYVLSPPPFLPSSSLDLTFF